MHARDLLGRRFTKRVETGHDRSYIFTADVDFTVVSVDPAAGQARVHVQNGERGEIALTNLLAAIDAGSVWEAVGAPFTLSRRAR